MMTDDQKLLALVMAILCSNNSKMNDDARIDEAKDLGQRIIKAAQEMGGRS
jgi:hypothetical protein